MRKSNEGIKKNYYKGAITITFYDTCALLELQEKAFLHPFFISSKTLEEIEKIKTSSHKDEDIKYKARKLSHLFLSHTKHVEIIYPNEEIFSLLDSYDLELTPDNLIISTAAYLVQHKNLDVNFITCDISCFNIAKHIFQLNTSYPNTDDNNYNGIYEVLLTDNQLADFYSNLKNNIFELENNQYLVIKNHKDQFVDLYKWTDSIHEKVLYKKYTSNIFGEIKPYHNDIYQICAMDSLAKNKLTLLKGCAGSGKSYLALGYLLAELEKGTINNITIFTNTVPTANSARLGFYPGSRIEKLYDSSIGTMLSSKFGDYDQLMRMVDEGQILLLPMCDIRGYQTKPKSGLYITEAQNMDISLMKLALQRISEDSICIIEGDVDAQVDMTQYDGSKNGMRRLSEVFRGQEFYGEVELKNIYRSEIAKIAELM